MKKRAATMVAVAVVALAACGSTEAVGVADSDTAETSTLEASPDETSADETSADETSEPTTNTTAASDSATSDGERDVAVEDADEASALALTYGQTSFRYIYDSVFTGRVDSETAREIGSYTDPEALDFSAGAYHQCLVGLAADEREGIPDSFAVVYELDVVVEDIAEVRNGLWVATLGVSADVAGRPDLFRYIAARIYVAGGGVFESLAVDDDDDDDDDSSCEPSGWELTPVGEELLAEADLAIG